MLRAHIRIAIIDATASYKVYYYKYYYCTQYMAICCDIAVTRTLRLSLVTGSDCTSTP